MNRDIHIVFDDREPISDALRRVVGERRYGDIVFQRHSVFEHFLATLPAWAKGSVVRLTGAESVAALRATLERGGDDATMLLVSARAAMPDRDDLARLVERLPYAKENFADRLYRPLIVFLHDAHGLMEEWQRFERAPLNAWEQPWRGYARLTSLAERDLGDFKQFLTLFAASTATRHFNHLKTDQYHCVKSSTDRDKIAAEHAFYGLVPEAMRPWLVQPFGFKDDGAQASYRMLRHYMADAAVPWSHGAFDAHGFASFLERLFFFLGERPRRPCDDAEARAMSEALFVEKPKARIEQFLADAEGRRIDALASHLPLPGLDAASQLERYLKAYAKHQRKMTLDHAVIGHGDPCLSNILYDHNSHLLLLIDPKGATDEAALWTNPLYDYCKVSHSVLGDYDFINSGMFDIALETGNTPTLRLMSYPHHTALKRLFEEAARETQYDFKALRLGEVSLFLSMLPLHLDHPSKVTAYLLRAKEILDEVEGAE